MSLPAGEFPVWVKKKELFFFFGYLLLEVLGYIGISLTFLASSSKATLGIGVLSDVSFSRRILDVNEDFFLIL
jgi:hypothetical protein